MNIFPRLRRPVAQQTLRAILVVTLLVGLFAVPLSGRAQTNVLQYHNDSFNSGMNPTETLLTPTNVVSSTFGKLFTQSVDGVVYAQPLVMTNVSIAGGTHDVLFVATEHDSVYAFDADNNLGANSTYLWHTSFLTGPTGTTVTTVPYTDVNCSQITPEIGITGTPVIDPVAGVLYVAAMTKEVTGSTTVYVHRLHALNISTGAEVSGWPIEVTASVTVNGSPVVLNSTTWKSYKTRPGLTLYNGVVYVCFSSHCDITPYHGWIVGYNTTTQAQTGVWLTTPTGSESSLWMGGCAPAVDQNGYIFLNTANGTAGVSSGFQNYGDSFVKLNNGTLPLLDYFTPYNQATLSADDLDTGSGGVMLLPNSAGSTAHPHLLTGAGKQGTIYLLDRDALGGTQSGSDSGAVQTLIGAIGGCFITPTFFNNVIYYIGSGDHLKGFSISPTSTPPINTTPATSSTTFESPGATPSVSYNMNATSSNSTGIVWAIENNSSAAILHAYNATPNGTSLTELYNSTQVSGDGIGSNAVKFSAPTIANGKTYVGTQNSVAIFGLRAVTVSGTISTQGCSPSAEALTFTFRPAYGAPFTMSATPAANGAFSLASVPAGTYTLAIQGPKYLRSDVTVNTTTGAVTGVTATLLTGDINGDNVVNLEDYNLLAAAFGSTSTSANWNPLADLNCDGVVNLRDFNLLAANFGKTGDP